MIMYRYGFNNDCIFNNDLSYVLIMIIETDCNNDYIIFNNDLSCFL